MPDALTVDAPSMPAVSVVGLHKAYGGVHALRGVDLTVERGRIHAIVGENGAGKSTLMKVLAGVVQPDAGTIEIGGRAMVLPTPAVAHRAGIGIVHQELSLFPERSILANLFPGDQPTRFGVVDTAEMRRRATPVVERIGLDVPLETRVGTLGVAERQLVELSRQLIDPPAVLILDEPNSALNEQETRRLFSILDDVRSAGVTVLYISHRLEEVFAISDRVTVMRNGSVVSTSDIVATSIPDVVRDMLGTAPTELYPPRRQRPEGDDGVLSVRSLSVDGDLRDVSFEARRGEVIGLAGLEGSGVDVVLEVLFGTRRPSRGRVEFPDGQGIPRSPTVAARRGICFVPADRRNDGLMLEASVETNVAHVAVGALRGRGPLLDRKAMRRAALRQIEQLDIRADGPTVLAGRLSGGNQQKVVLAKWLEVDPQVFLLDDPTRGVDVGAKGEIYRVIRALAERGGTVLFRSTEFPEILGLADRVLVFYRGLLTLEEASDAIDDHQLLHAINTGRIGEDPTGDTHTEGINPA